MKISIKFLKYKKYVTMKIGIKISIKFYATSASRISIYDSMCSVHRYKCVRCGMVDIRLTKVIERETKVRIVIALPFRLSALTQKAGNLLLLLASFALCTKGG